jgi:hypothetical protein
MLPGGRLRGPSEPCAADFSPFAAAREVEVEVRPAAPRSVTTWSVVRGGALFLPADFLTPWKRWPYHVLADPRIRVRIGGRIFECRAERAVEPAEVDALRRAAAEKYDVSPTGLASRAEVWWFRAVRREPR